MTYKYVHINHITFFQINNVIQFAKEEEIVSTEETNKRK